MPAKVGTLKSVEISDKYLHLYLIFEQCYVIACLLLHLYRTCKQVNENEQVYNFTKHIHVWRL